MRILLDTCTFLWMLAEPEKLTDFAQQAVTDPDNQLYLSAASSWEIAVKVSLDRLPLPEPAGSLIPRMRERLGIESLPLDEASVFHLTRLPALHRDPFDRILICQAIHHGLALLSPDEMIRQYPARVIW